MEILLIGVAKSFPHVRLEVQKTMDIISKVSYRANEMHQRVGGQIDFKVFACGFLVYETETWRAIIRRKVKSQSKVHRILKNHYWNKQTVGTVVVYHRFYEMSIRDPRILEYCKKERIALERWMLEPNILQLNLGESESTAGSSCVMQRNYI